MKWDPLDTEGGPVRVAVVDDHVMAIGGIHWMLAEVPEYVVTMSLQDARLLDLELPEAERPHVAIVDMCMPHMDGEQTIRTLRQHWPGTRVLAMSMHATAEKVRKALEAGACGFLPKCMSKQCLGEALESVLRRGHYHDDDLYRELLAAGLSTTEKVLETALSPRERQVLDCACLPEEYTWDMVADLLKMKLCTVDTHRHNLFVKLKVKSKAGLVSYGLQHGYGKGVYWRAS